MRNVRAAVAAITTLSLVGAMASMGGAAQAATTGVGTSQVSTTVANVQLGTNGALLGVRLLGDDARSTIDSKVASAAEAFSRFTGVAVSSDTVPALKALSSPAVESKQPGGSPSRTTGSIDLSNPAPDVTIPSTVLSGTIGLAHLSSEAAEAQAKSALSATLTNATVGGALASVSGVTSSLNTAATSAQSDGSRSVKVDQVVVLDLASLLAGLDLPLVNLPVDTIQGLLTELGTTVTGLGAPATVNGIIDDLQTQIDDLEAAVDAGATALPTGQTITTIVNVVNSTPLGTVVDSTEVTDITNLTTVADQLDALIDAAQGTLADVLEGVLSTLDGAPLLSVDSVDVGVTTKAADTVANSAAGVTAKVGAIKVGVSNLGSVDLVDALTTINTTVEGVNTKIEETLGVIHPELKNLVKVSVFERPADKGVSEADGYVTAVDGITALKASVTPPATLAAILATIDAQTSITDDILAGGGALPADLSTAMTTLGVTTLNNNVAPLGGGANVTIASLNSTSNFAPQIAGSGSGGPGEDNDRSLAATGSNDTVPMTALALLLIALGLGFREWIRMPVPVRTKQ